MIPLKGRKLNWFGLLLTELIHDQCFVTGSSARYAEHPR
jgi:hypothetical protein